MVESLQKCCGENCSCCAPWNVLWNSLVLFPTENAQNLHFRHKFRGYKVAFRQFFALQSTAVKD